jgi:hypothetical protein
MGVGVGVGEGVGVCMDVVRLDREKDRKVAAGCSPQHPCRLHGEDEDVRVEEKGRRLELMRALLVAKMWRRWLQRRKGC